jgi:hypothetical protein
MTSAQLYCGYRHAIRSTVIIPGAIAMADAITENLEIRIDERPLAISVATRVVGPYRLSPEGLCFEAPGVARYLCTAGQIVVERAQGARDDLVGGFLVATALPACLWMRGAFVLHAGAVVLPGSDTAVAIGGASGSGKSYLLSQLVDTGGRLVADDTLTLTAEAPGAVASGLPGGYMLRADPRIFHAVPLENSVRSATLGALAILPLPRDANRIGFSRLTSTDAVAALLANRHRPRIPALLGLEQAHLPLLAELASRLPIYSWGRCEGEPRLDARELAFLASL